MVWGKVRVVIAGVENGSWWRYVGVGDEAVMKMKKVRGGIHICNSRPRIAFRMSIPGF